MRGSLLMMSRQTWTFFFLDSFLTCLLIISLCVWCFLFVLGSGFGGVFLCTVSDRGGKIWVGKILESLVIITLGLVWLMFLEQFKFVLLSELRLISLLF